MESGSQDVTSHPPFMMGQSSYKIEAASPSVDHVDAKSISSQVSYELGRDMSHAGDEDAQSQRPVMRYEVPLPHWAVC